MKTIVRTAAAVVLTASVFGSIPAKAPELDRPDPSRGIIGLTVKVIPPAKMGLDYAQLVYFVRVDEPGDRFAAGNVIPSNYAKGESVFLLNAEPGRYVAVGCMWEHEADGFTGRAVFSEADIAQTEVEVKAGTPVFMGAIEASSSTKIDRADAAQAHYLGLIAPHPAEKNFLVRALSSDHVYTSSFRSIVRDKTAAYSFWLEADAKHFSDNAEWKKVVAVGFGAATPSAAPAAAAEASAVASAPIPESVHAPAAGRSGSRDGKIPKERLRDGVYTSPDGGFTLKVPQIYDESGAKGEERSLGAKQWAVAFVDDSGHGYYLIRTDNRDPRLTLEQITSEIPVGLSLRSKETVNGERGAEARVTGVLEHGSPLHSQTKPKGGPATDTKLDLLKASSLFLHGEYAYEVTVAVTRLHDDQTDDDLLARAKKDLETFLSGLVLQEP